MVKMIPKSRVDPRKYREVFHTIENGMEYFREYDRYGNNTITRSQETASTESLSEILYYDKETNLLMKHKLGNMITCYKYDTNQNLVGYYTEVVK